MKRKLITSALPYVNNVPHLGNIIGCVLSADVYARFCRSRGYETLYVCGTDEYGTATENKAREEGLTPREVCDKYHAIHVQVYRDFNISFDVFGRTSTATQTEIAQSIFHDLDQRGFITDKAEQRTFCEKDDMFLADRFVEGRCPHCDYEDARGDQCDNCGRLLEPEKLASPRCKFCGTAPVLKETSHLFLKLDALQDKLSAWFDAAHRDGHWTRNAVTTTSGWLERGLQERPITRDLKWGIPVPKPGYEKKVFYVWFDAPIGYISITAHQYDDWQRWWQAPDDVDLYQFMAKDNIPFHTVIFPASLLGSGRDWTLLHHINSTEYLNYENAKFSKSRNVGVFGTDVRDTQIPVDLWRFYLLYVRPENNDSVFNWLEFFERVNNDFIDNIGNLTNRTLVYLNKNFAGTIRDLDLPDTHRTFVAECEARLTEIATALEAVKLRDALRLILALGNHGNKFFQDMAPWVHIKTDSNHAHATVSVLAYLVRNLAVCLEPYMPTTAQKILQMLQKPATKWADMGFTGLDGHCIGSPEILYRKLDLKQAEKWRKKFSGDAPNFGIFNMVCGRIDKVENHTNSDRLYVLKVDVGAAAPRQIVAGLVKHYTAEELQDRQVLVLTNLKTADIQGVASQGMVLVCEKRKRTELIATDGMTVGERATVADQTIKDSDITIEQFKAAPLQVVDHALLFDDQPINMADQAMRTQQISHGKIR